MIAAVGCSHSAAEARERLDKALNAAVTADAGDDDADDVHGGVMLVDAPRHGLLSRSAAGIRTVATGAPMTAETAFLSASVGKLFVAAAVLNAVKDGLIELDAPMTRYVAIDAVAGLPVVGGDDALARVTVRQLLSHRSGLPDYFSDASSDGAPRLFDLIASAPERRYTRQDLLDYARAHYKPVGAPGERFHYADTNSDLLGMVLEGATGAEHFSDVVRARVIDPLGLKHTWYHAFEAHPTDAAGDAIPVADVFVNGVNLWGIAALSADQAGGGLVTTVDDLRAFMRGLVAGTPVSFDDFGDDYAQDAMHAGIDVGLGVWRIRPGGVFFLLASQPTLVGHSGATGVWAYYAKDLDAVVVGAVSSAAWQEKHIEFLLSEVLPALAATRTTPQGP
jgi:D-alanyl-D-alanine carboxypeptidase